jgi:carbamoyltransferase
MRILNICTFYHDSAAALIENNRIVAAALGERFTRRKQDPGFREHAIQFCLSESGIGLRDPGRNAFDSSLR